MLKFDKYSIDGIRWSAGIRWANKKKWFIAVCYGGGTLGFRIGKLKWGDFII